MVNGIVLVHLWELVNVVIGSPHVANDNGIREDELLDDREESGCVSVLHRV